MVSAHVATQPFLGLAVGGAVLLGTLLVFAKVGGSRFDSKRISSRVHQQLPFLGAVIVLIMVMSIDADERPLLAWIAVVCVPFWLGMGLANLGRAFIVRRAPQARDQPLETVLRNGESSLGLKISIVSWAVLTLLLPLAVLLLLLKITAGP